VQVFEAGELRREAAGAGGVHNQQHLAGESGQRHRVALDGVDYEIVNGFHRTILRLRLRRRRSGPARATPTMRPRQR